MTVSNELALKITRVVQADPETVFKAWTEEEGLKEWFSPEGLSVPSAEVDLKVGGSYRIVMLEPDGKKHVVVGVYREITPPKRLVMTWRWESNDAGMDEGRETLVTVELTPADDGATEVVLVHENFADQESKTTHGEGWTSCLNRLEALYAGGR